MRPPRGPVFLERRSYRRRRLIDAARLLPLLGVLLLGVPMLWPQGPEQGVPASRAILYIFGIWAGLALASALLVRRLPDEALEAYDAGVGDLPADAPNRRPLRSDEKAG
ncbi:MULTISPECIES: hypothetical protein [Pseudooceanicola]|uniref:hypothetical protein n=1 Tax=Pseudooceanicola TaxID=1679449 RepID=UPI001EF0CE68|nr:MULTISPECIES: hypothetical protein [Pseudooceanicola]